MTKNVYKNEQIKRKFLEHLQGAEGFSDSSINTFAEAIFLWQEFFENEDFVKFNKSKAIEFHDWLKEKKARNKSGKLSLVTQYNYLRRVKRFFEWLTGEPNYKSKIKKNDVAFLRLSKGDARIARQGTTKQIPTFEEAKLIIKNIEIKNEIDMRDRAVICLALTTGMRISAITTLKMKNFDLENKVIDQNPADGVKTKNSKRIRSTFFPINWDGPENYFVEWYQYLYKKGFRDNDPIFPSTLNGKSENKHVYSKDCVSDKHWSGTNGIRKIFEKRCRMANLPYFHPHSFRHLISDIMSKAKITEEQKKAISLNLGHANVGTTFGVYGYGNMTEEDAVEIVKKIDCNEGKKFLSNKEIAFLKEIVDKIS